MTGNPPPPQNILAEAATLGAMLLNAKAVTIVIGVVRVRDFWREAHRTIFDAIGALYERGGKIDAITVGAELDRRGQLETVGGLAFIRELAENCPAPTSAVYYAKIVREQSVRRDLVRCGNEIAEFGYDLPENMEELVMRERWLGQILRQLKD